MANGGRIDYSIGFNVDKTGLNQIKSSLQEIKNLTAQDIMRIGGHSDIKKAENELKALKTSISQIDSALDRAFNTDLGTLNVSKFNQALKGLNLNKVYQDFSKAGVAGQTAFRNVTSQILTTNMQLKQTHSFINNMATTMANTVKWGAASSVMNGFTRNVQKAYGYVKSLDTSLNDIRIVTGKSADEMERFAVKANNAAKELGKSTTDYTKASLIYYQQGLSDKDVAARAETTLKAANVTGQSGEAVSEQLTAVWNGYKVSAEEAELYIDKLAAVAAKTAADLEELSTGMSKVASAADLMGVDIDQLNAQMATIVSVTRQAPESVGTALKTIYARMGDIEAGLDADTTLGHYTEEMKAMGVNVLDANGKLRDMGSVIEEIGGKWQSMTREQQIALSQTMAGTRQYNNLLSLFDNWDMYTKALNTSANAAGTLQQQQDIYMESTQAHFNQLKAASEDLYDSLLDTDTINGVADGLTFVVKRFTDLVDGIGGGNNTLLMLGSTATKVFSQQIAQGLATTIKNFQNVEYNAKQVSAVFRVLNQFKTLGIDDEATKKIVAWKEQIMQLGSIVTAEEHNQANSIMQTRVELQNQADQWENTKQKAEQYIKTLESPAKQKITNISKDDAKILTSQIDDEIKNYQKATNEAKAYSDNVSRLSDSLANQTNIFRKHAAGSKEVTAAEEETSKAVKQVIADMDLLKGSSESVLRSIDKTTNEYTELRNAIKEYNLALKDGDDSKIQQSAEKLVAAYRNANLKLQEQAKQTKQTVSREAAGASEDFKRSIKEAEQTWSQFINQLNSTKKIQSIVNIVGAVGQLVSVINTLSSIKDIINDESLTGAEKTLKIISALTMAIPMLSMALKTLKIDIGNLLVLTNLITEAQLKEVGVSGALKAAWTAEGGALKGLVTTLGVYALAIAAIVGTIYLVVKAYNKEKDALESATTAVQNQTEALEKLKNAQDAVNKSISAYEEARKKVDSLVEGTQEWRDATNEANAAVLELLDRYPELADEIDNVNGALKISEAGLEKAQELSSNAVNQAQSDLYLAKANKLDKENDYKTIEAGRNINYQVGNQQYTVADDTIDQVVAKINESGSGFLKDAETLQKELGTMNQELAEALVQNGEDLQILANEVAANTAAMQIYNQQAASGYLQEDEDYQNATESQKAIIDKIAGSKLQAETDKLYEQKYKDGMGKRDKEIQQEYAKLIGVDPTQTRDKGKNIGEYFIDGEWQKISDETARMALAAEEASSSLEGLSKGVIEASESISKIDGMTENVQNAALGFANGETADLSGLNTSELEQLSNTNFTDEIAQQLGFEGDNPAVDYMAAIDKAISQELENRKNKLQEELDNAPDTITENLNGIMSKSELETFNEAGGIDMSAIDIGSLNKMLEEGLSLEDVFDKIDWSSIDPSKPTEWFKAAFEQAIGDATYTKENEEDVEGNYSKHAEEFGIDEEAYRNTTELIQDMAKESKELDDALKDQEDIAQEVAKDLLRYDKAVQSVKESSEDWLDALESGNIQDIGDYMDDITAAYSNMFDIDASKLSDDFLTSTENMEDLQAAANGSEEAYNRLAEAARQDMAAQVGFDDAEFQAGFQDLMDKYYEGQNLEDLSVGASLDNQDFLNGLTDMVNQAGMTAQEATDYLSSMGIDAEVETDTVTTPETSTVVTGYKPRIAWNDSSFNIGPASFDFKVPSLQFDTITEQVPTDKQIAANSLKVTSAKKSSGGGVKHKNSSHGGGSKGGGKKGGGGGGGGGSSKPKTEKKLESKKDRYHDVNVRLSQIDDQLEDIGKDQEKLFGKDLIDSLNEELEILEKQRDTLKEKLDIARQEQAELQHTLRQSGVDFNADGTIANYLSIIEQKEAEYNALIDQYNAMDAASQENFKETVLDPAKENLDKLYENIKAYDDLILDTIPEIENGLDDITDREVEINIQKMNMEMELRLDLVEARKDWNDFKREVLDNLDDEDLFGNALADKELFEQIWDSEALKAGADELKEIIGEINDINETGSSDIFGEDKQAALEELKTSMEDLMGVMEELDALQEAIAEGYLESIDKVADAFDGQVESYEFVNDLVQHNLDMIELLHGDDAYAEMAKSYEQMEKNNLDIVAANKQAVDYYKQMMETETDPEAVKKWEELWTDAVSNLNDSVEESAQTIIDKYTNTINQIFDELNDKLTNGKGLDYVNLEWELSNENQDAYLDAINSEYELQQLERTYRDSIGSADSISAQRSLNKLMDEELKKLREKDKLTQYDIDRANAKYELRLKEIALEEAQQNKTQMRLRRDSSGNYSYQFVADQDSVSAAQQEVDEARNSLYNMDKDAYRENQQAILDVWNEYQEKMRDSANLSAEERALIQQQYEERINGLLEENTAIRLNLTESAMTELTALYDQNAVDFQNMTDAEKQIIWESLIPNWDNGVQQMAKIFVDEGGFLPTCQDAFNQLDQATVDYNNSLQLLESTAGTSFGAMAEGYNENIGLAEELAEKQQENIDNCIEEQQKIADLRTEVDNLAASYKAVWDNAAGALTAAQELLTWEQEKAAREAEEERLRKEQEQQQQQQGSGGGSSSGGSGSGGGSNQGLTSDIIDGVAGAIYYWTPAAWGTGNERKQKIESKFGSGSYNKIQGYINQHVDMAGNLKQQFKYGWGERDKYKNYYYSKFDTGGYTGDWIGEDGKLAMLHQKELVLNADDTQNFLAAISMVRDMSGIFEAMNDSILSRVTGMTNALAPQAMSSGMEQNELNQNVNIQASFPGVSSRAEIEQAFANLVNMASQHAYNTRR